MFRLPISTGSSGTEGINSKTEEGTVMNQVEVSEKIRVPKHPELAELCADWAAQLPPLERAKGLRRLVDKGISRRAIAKAVRCSEAWIRQLLDLERLTAEENQAMRKGLLSVG